MDPNIFSSYSHSGWWLKGVVSVVAKPTQASTPLGRPSSNTQTNTRSVDIPWT